MGTQTDDTHKNIEKYIQSLLSKAESSDEVFSIIQSNWYKITKPGVYSLAFKICIRYKDYLMTQKIMDLLIYSNVEPTIYQFTQFFNAMALSDVSPTITDEYFQRMCNEYNIIPDKFLFCILIKMCGKETKAIKLFYQFYDKLKNQQVQFDVTTFHSFLSIFTRNGDINGMEEAFKVINEQKIEWNKLFVTEIMNGYINANKSEKAI